MPLTMYTSNLSVEPELAARLSDVDAVASKLWGGCPYDIAPDLATDSGEQT